MRAPAPAPAPALVTLATAAATRFACIRPTAEASSAARLVTASAELRSAYARHDLARAPSLQHAAAVAHRLCVPPHACATVCAPPHATAAVRRAEQRMRQDAAAAVVQRAARGASARAAVQVRRAEQFAR
jgi:hypothetical protein